MVRLPQGTGPGGAGPLAAGTSPRALHLRVTGIVQGVGFRPFLHRLAERYGLAGWARNEAGEVLVCLEGAPDALQAFLRDLGKNAPVLARIDRVDVTPAAAEGQTGFRVLASGEVDPARVQPVPADVATCDACLSDLRNPSDRRYRYPFITCTDCGPRFTVIEAVPYERARTSMRAFPMCPACSAEFANPSDRRFHSETNSCPECGPALWYETGRRADGPTAGRGYAAALAEAVALLASGRILALRGIGGYHLAVDATDEAAVRRLRERKHREAKPLAVMVRTLDEARGIAEVDASDAALLASAERPIVLLAARPGAVAAAVHPGLDRIGVMLAYSPVHQLLLDAVGRPLVMTSGNLSDEPIAASLEEGRARLGSIADGFLMHDREIVARADDSVVRVSGAGPILLRRARGYAPLPLGLPVPAPRHLLAVGPHLKNTATLARDGLAFVTPHVGDLETIESLEHFRHLVDACRHLFHVEPEAVVRDLHPGYLSTRVALESGLPVIAVQHHHAHVAAVLAEHGRTDRVIGLAFDGTGYGEDGAVWGAEILAADLESFSRLGQLRYAPLPGGDLAARRPWRVALGYLSRDPTAAGAFRLAFDGIDPTELEIAGRQITRSLNAPLASSMGRLFDGAAAVLGVRQAAHYEGQAAMELEALAGRRPGTLLPFPVSDGVAGSWILEPIPLLAALGERRQRGDDLADLAAAFHASLADGAVRIAALAAAAEGVRTVVLGGGVFQNARLLDTIKSGLEAQGFEVLVPRRLSPNDGAISYGQAAIGAARLAADARLLTGAR